MKKISISLIILICGFTLNAQVIKEAAVPAVVKNKFAVMFPDVKVKKWEKEEEKYEVSFKNVKEKTALLFDANGTYIQTEVEIQVTDLPKSITEYVTKNFTAKEVEIEEAAKITAANGSISYKAEIDGSDYFFDEKGNFLRKEKDDDDDSDDD